MAHQIQERLLTSCRIINDPQRQTRIKTKDYIVLDASAKSSESSLNDCLYTGPSFGQFILDILLHFRAHEVALAGDIRESLSDGRYIEPTDRDFLRLLWVENTTDDPPKIPTLCFTRMVLRVKSSPFLLNGLLSIICKLTDTLILPSLTTSSFQFCR